MSQDNTMLTTGAQDRSPAGRARPLAPSLQRALRLLWSGAALALLSTVLLCCGEPLLHALGSPPWLYLLIVTAGGTSLVVALRLVRTARNLMTQSGPVLTEVPTAAVEPAKPGTGERQ